MTGNSEIAVRVEGLGKRFSLRDRPDVAFNDFVMRQYASARHQLKRMLTRQAPDGADRAANEFWALRDIEFELRYGEVLGVVGKNGAGKSTLLKILAQVLAPTTGRAMLYGRVGALLEVGTGFNPELSGRENIYLYGAILGMERSDIRRRFDEIVAFAEIEKFLEQPIKNYSSGMHSRLAFSVAAHLECDILLVDEVLSVGDAAFRRKCLGKMEDVTGQGRAVIFVSHNMSAINNMCSRGIVIKDGQLVFSGSSEDATGRYMELCGDAPEGNSGEVFFDDDPELDVQILRIKLATQSASAAVERFSRREPIRIEVDVEVRIPSVDYSALVTLDDSRGNRVLQASDDEMKASVLSEVLLGGLRICVSLPANLLRVGTYYLTVKMYKREMGSVDKRSVSFRVFDDFSHDAMRVVEHRRHIIQPILDWDVSVLEKRVGAGPAGATRLDTGGS